MTGDLTCVNVTQSALVEFIERVAVAGGSDIRVSQGDRGWYVTYRPPFTRDIKEDGALVIEEAEADCEGDKDKCGDTCHAKSKQKND